jgi:hypothetical protein
VSSRRAATSATCWTLRCLVRERFQSLELCLGGLLCYRLAKMTGLQLPRDDLVSLAHCLPSNKPFTAQFCSTRQSLVYCQLNSKAIARLVH